MRKIKNFGIALVIFAWLIKRAASDRDMKSCFLAQAREAEHNETEFVNAMERYSQARYKQGYAEGVSDGYREAMGKIAELVLSEPSLAD